MLDNKQYTTSSPLRVPLSLGVCVSGFLCVWVGSTTPVCTEVEASQGCLLSCMCCDGEAYAGESKRGTRLPFLCNILGDIVVCLHQNFTRFDAEARFVIYSG